MESDGPQGTAGGDSAGSPQPRTERIARLVAEYSDRLNARDPLRLSDVIAQHPDLAPELAEALRALSTFSSEVRSDLPSLAVGDYQILREIGRGGMGIVYEALQVPLNRRVALKVLPRDLLPNPRAIARFQHEARVASQLNHPGICTVYEARVEGGVPYIAMQFVEGETLARRIAAARESRGGAPATPTLPLKRSGGSENAMESSGRLEGSAALGEKVGPEGAVAVEGRVDLQDAAGLEGSSISVAATISKAEIQKTLLLVEKAARALHVAHEAGFVHRDMKPGNVMVTPAGEPVILDFGLAQEEEDQKRITVSGELLGTPAYMSPEQIAASRIKVDRRTDVYSLGVTLYEALTLKLPFDAPTREGIFRKILASDPPDPRSLNRNIPRDLRVVLETALEKDLDRRYQSALDFAEDLRRVRQYETVRVRPAGPVLKLRRWARRNPVVATATLGIFLVLAVGLAVALVLLGQVRQERDAKVVALGEKDKALEAAEAARAQTEKALGEKEKALGEKDAALSTAQAESKAKEQALARAEAEAEAKAKALEEKDEALRWSDDRRICLEAFALCQTNPGLALLLAIEGARRLQDLVANKALLACLQEFDEHLVFGDRKNPVAQAGLSPDGKRVVVALKNRRFAKIHDGKTGQPLVVLKGHEGSVTAAKFSPDGSAVVTASAEEGAARMWDASSGQCLRVLRGHPESPHLAASFTPRGTYVVTNPMPHERGNPTSAYVWLASSGAKLYSVGGASGGLLCLEFSPDDKLLATGWMDATVRLLDAATGAELHLLKGHKKYVGSVMFSADGRRVLTVSGDQTARIWDTETGVELSALESKEDEYGGTGTFSPAWDLQALDDGQGKINLYKTATGELVRSFEGHDYGVARIYFTKDGQRLISTGADKTIRVWEVSTGFQLHVLRGSESYVWTAQLAEDGQSLLTDSEDGTVRLWTLPPPRDVATLEGHRDVMKSACFSPDGARVVTASQDHTARIWDAATGQQLRVLHHEAPVGRATFSPDGKLVLTGAWDGKARIWDAATGEMLRVLAGGGQGYTRPDFSPSGDRIITVEEGPRFRIWDPSTGNEVITLEEAGFPRAQDARIWVVSHGLAWSADGSRIFYRQHQGIAWWDASTGKLLHRLELDPRTSMDVDESYPHLSVSPDGRSLAAPLRQGSARIWDVRTGETLRTLDGHEGTTDDACFSPDGARIVTASEDGTARVWDLKGDKEPLVLRGHELGLVSARFSPDGRRVVTGSSDGTARIWDASTGEEISTFRAGKSVSEAVFSPDGARVLLQRRPYDAQLWPGSDLLALATSRTNRVLTPEERETHRIGSPEDRARFRRRWELEYFLSSPVVEAVGLSEGRLAIYPALLFGLRKLEATLSGKAPEDSRSLSAREVLASLGEIARAGPEMAQLSTLVERLHGGAKAPPIQVSRWLRGDAAALAAAEANVRIVAMLSRACAPCLESFPRLSDIARRCRDRGVAVIGLFDEDSPELDGFWQQSSQSVDFLLAVDGNRESSSALLRDLGAPYLPRALVIDRDGSVLWDGHPLAEVEKVVEEVLAGTFDRWERATDLLRRKDSSFHLLPGLEKVPGNPCWSSDGTRVAFLELTGARGVSVRDIKTGKTREFDVKANALSWAPDGRRLAFGHRQEKGGISVLDLITGEAADIRPEAYLLGGSAWSPSGSWIAYRKNPTSTSPGELWITDAAGQRYRSLGGETAFLKWSDDGKDLFAFRGEDRKLVAIAADEPNAHPRELFTAGEDEAVASLSPDGRLIALETHDKYHWRSAYGRFRVVDLGTGAELMQKVLQGIYFYAPSAYWAPDGRNLLCDFQPSGGQWLLDPVGGTSFRVLPPSHRPGRWSPDGKQLGITWMDFSAPPGRLEVESWLLDADTLRGLRSCPLPRAP